MAGNPASVESTSPPAELDREEMHAPPLRGRFAAGWFALLAGPIAWIMHLQVVYALVPWDCLTGRKWVLHAVTAGFLLITIASAAVAVGLYRKEGRRWPSGEDEGKPGTLRLMAAVGMMSGVLFTLAIVGQEIATFYIHPCQD
jgi:hypothetical protein